MSAATTTLHYPPLVTRIGRRFRSDFPVGLPDAYMGNDGETEIPLFPLHTLRAYNNPLKELYMSDNGMVYAIQPGDTDILYHYATFTEQNNLYRQAKEDPTYPTYMTRSGERPPSATTKYILVEPADMSQNIVQMTRGFSRRITTKGSGANIQVKLSDSCVVIGMGREESETSTQILHKQDIDEFIELLNFLKANLKD